ncbi:14159_t:CDS:10, partial [Gigaspora rosea]
MAHTFSLIDPIKRSLTIHILILELVILSFFTLNAYAKVDNLSKLLGVEESKAHLYEAKGPDWTCLDGSATIPYEAINDDFCDCADGSDEPGTSACPNSKFNCRNIGHISSFISSSRVNDGVCEPECCDGSDEYDGKIKCPNICKETNAEYTKKLKELEKLRAQGIRIKKEYIEKGRKIKTKNVAELNRLEIELKAAKIRVKEREAALKKIEDSKTDTEQLAPKGNRERMKKIHERIIALKGDVTRLHEQIDTLLSILKDMKNNHNQNYHDMAERFLEMLWEIKDGVLELFGLQSKRYYSSSSSRDTPKELTAARDAFEEAEQEQKDIENHIDEIKSKLSQDYGLEYEFAALDNECFSYDSGDLCMFGSATQKSNKDHSSTDLGNFAKWFGAESSNDPRYYTRMLYEDGARCWNGPARSVKLYLECGADNQILSVSEPEKCEYHMRMISPAVCGIPPSFYVGDYLEKEKHIFIFHTSRQCSCGFEVESLPGLAQHKRTTCPEKLITCRFCYNLVKQGSPSTNQHDLLEGLTAHESYCGGRTTTCVKCHQPVVLKNIATHNMMHEIEKQNRKLPPLCRNKNCVRIAADNVLKLCAICFGPFWSPTADPEKKMLYTRVARKYHSQLTTGCGQSWCKNLHCATGNSSPQDPTTAALSLTPLLKQLQLSTTAFMYLCVDEQTTKKRTLANILYK